MDEPLRLGQSSKTSFWKGPGSLLGSTPVSFQTGQAAPSLLLYLTSSPVLLWTIGLAGGVGVTLPLDACAGGNVVGEVATGSTVAASPIRGNRALSHSAIPENPRIAQNV